MTCEPGDIVVVPFPFVERRASRRRPALVLSTQAFNRSGHTVLAMITSRSHAPWPGDVTISERETAGLHTDCRVRLKLFTLDNRLIVRGIGRLAANDLRAVATGLTKYLRIESSGENGKGSPPTTNGAPESSDQLD